MPISESPGHLTHQINANGKRFAEVTKQINDYQQRYERASNPSLVAGGWFNRFMYLMPFPVLLTLDGLLLKHGLENSTLDLGPMAYEHAFWMFPLAVAALDLFCLTEFERERTPGQAANLSVSRALFCCLFSLVTPVLLLTLFFTMKTGGELYLVLLTLLSWVGHLLLVFDPLMTNGLRSLGQSRDRWYYGSQLRRHERRRERIVRDTEAYCSQYPDEMEVLKANTKELNLAGRSLWHILIKRA